MSLTPGASYDLPFMLSNPALTQGPRISSAALLYGRQQPSYSSLPSYDVTSWPPYLPLPPSVSSNYIPPQSTASSGATSLPYQPALIPPTSDLSMPMIASSHVPVMMMPSPSYYPSTGVPIQDGNYPLFIPFTSGDYDIPVPTSAISSSINHYAALAAMLHEATTSPPTSSSSTVSVRPSSSTTPPSSIDDRVSRQIAKSSFHNHGGVSKPLGRRNWTAEDYKKLIDAHNSGSDALETAKAIGIPRSTASRFAENSI